MQSQNVFRFGVLFCIVCAIISVTAGGKGDHKMWKEKMAKCGEGKIDLEEAFKGKDECKPEKKSTDEESRRRRSPEEGKRGKGKRKGMRGNLCTMVCMWKKQGILNESGQFSESGAQEHVNKVYPEAVRADAFTKIKDCGDNKSSTFSMEDKCSGYEDFKKCLWNAHKNACGLKFKGGNKDAQRPPPSTDEQADEE